VLNGLRKEVSRAVGVHALACLHWIAIRKAGARLTAIPFSQETKTTKLRLGGEVWGVCEIKQASWKSPKLLCVAVKQTRGPFKTIKWAQTI
jgi:hypothetical protein